MIAAVNVHLNRIACLGAFAMAAFCLLAYAARADAAPQWNITAAANPTAPQGGQAKFLVEVQNVGDAVADGTGGDPIVLTVDLESGLTVDGVAFSFGSAANFPATGWACTGQGSGAFSCEIPESIAPSPTDGFGGDFLGAGMPVMITAAVAGEAAGTLSAAFEVSWPGADDAATVETVTVENAAPQFGVSDFDAQVTADPAGAPFTQAAGTPYAALSAVELYSDDDAADPGADTLWPVEPVKDIVVDVPPGFVGDPTAADKCTLLELSHAFSIQSRPLCPPSSQVGTVRLRFNFTGSLNFTPIPVFNLETGPDVPARFGFATAGTAVLLDAEVRSESDYGATVRARNTPSALPIQATELTLWGVPADESHLPDRACPEESLPAHGGPSCESDAPLATFLRNPTACTPEGVGLPMTVHASSWFDPAGFDTKTIQTHLPPGWPAAPADWGAPQGPTGCDKVPFTPSFAGQPSGGAQARQPAGFSFDLSLPQTDEPGVIGQSDLRDAVVTLPAGLRVNPASADGLGACTLDQANLDSRGPAACPPASKIGSLEVQTPLLEKPLTGGVYLAKQFDNPFDSLLAVYLVAEGQGVNVKLPGKVEILPDGRVRTVFDEQPQLPFENLHLELKGGPRAPLTMPESCGTHTVQSTFTGWNGKVVNLSSPFTVDGGCVAEGFSPTLSAGVDSPLAGAHSPFALQVKRSDSDQEISLLGVSTPQGLTATLKGVAICPQAAIDAAKAMGNPGQGALELASPACPAASQVGTVQVGAGAGSNPFYLNTGRAYLAGPYKGAPLSLAIAAPAVAGPFDLGNVVVQSAIHVDPATAQIRAVSDPLPTALHGIELQLRDIRVDLNRPNFTLNPTSCEEMSVNATLTSLQGAHANPSDRFQLAECSSLGFKPKLGLRLRGGTRRGSHPRLIASLRARAGDANIARTQVTLPKSAFLDQSHIRTVCTRVQFAAEQCPPGSIYGRASAITPLLDYPLAGPVYLRSSSNKLPDLVLALSGPAHQPIEIELAGRTDSARGALRNTFDFVPDAPVTSFRLELFGGKRGLVEVSRDLCAHRYRAKVAMDAHNGKIGDSRPRLRADCKKGKRAKKGKGKRRGK